MVLRGLPGFESGYDPLREFSELQREMNRLFNGYRGRSSEFPMVNVWANEDETVVAAEIRPEPFQPAELSPGRPSLHATIQEYNGPESCTGAGCHDGGPLESNAQSAHSQRIAAVGPNPWLAKLVDPDQTSPTETGPDCLVCHAEELHADDPLASAQTVRAAGGDTCLRCHTNDFEDSVHIEVGLACVSCHFADQHEISVEVECAQCHPEMPHQDPLLNVKHQRLDCRTCHTHSTTQLLVDTGQATQNPLTGYYWPEIENSSVETPAYAWHTADGQPASIENEAAKIVPIRLITLRAPEDLEPAPFAATGQAGGSTTETVLEIVPSHGVTMRGARTCDTCHGPNSNFNFASLGYSQEQIDQLTTRSAETE